MVPLHNSKVMACLPGRWGCALLCGWGRFSVPGANYYIGKTGTVWHPKEPLVENNCWNQSIQNRGNLRFWLTGVSFKYFYLIIWSIGHILHIYLILNIIHMTEKMGKHNRSPWSYLFHCNDDVLCYDVQLCVWYWVKRDTNLKGTLMETCKVMGKG